MGKTAYLIATDLHMSYKNLRSRVDYRNEIAHVCQNLIKVAEEYTKKGYSITLLLLGDVFHNAYNSVFAACNDNNFFYRWALRYGAIYSLLGNHELTYYSSNPFYTLVSCIESDKVKRIINRIWEPLGSLPVIRVVDTVEDGDVIFHFNHYNAGVAEPKTGKVNIGLFHQNIVCDEIKKISEARYGTTLYGPTAEIEKMGTLDGYQYCFFGHMHSIYGSFKTDSGVILCYLASLGRTNITEVSDRFLERNIPVVAVDSGKFTGVFDNKFNLLSRAESVVEQVAKENQDKLALDKAVKEIKKSNPLSSDSVQNVVANLMNNTLSVSIFKEMIEKPIDDYGAALHKSMQDAFNKYVT